MKEKILVIDDEEMILKTLDKLLSKEGYEVTTVNSSYTALAHVKKEFFDLIVLDVRMPQMDGISLLKQIRRIQEDKKSMVIVITGYASEDVPIKAIELGVEGYIMKPFELESFLYSVNGVMEICRLRKERDGYLKELEKKNRELEELRDKYRNLVNSLTRVVWAKTNSKDLEDKIKKIIKSYEKK
ncbi:MAG: response regulator [Candidatus Altiarchaeota archaeon]|nr:response regulator [Candidatus Altiarchaeota archaeon]